MSKGWLKTDLDGSRVHLRLIGGLLADGPA